MMWFGEERQTTKKTQNKPKKNPQTLDVFIVLGNCIVFQAEQDTSDPQNQERLPEQFSKS